MKHSYHCNIAPYFANWPGPAFAFDGPRSINFGGWSVQHRFNAIVANGFSHDQVAAANSFGGSS